MEKAHEAVIRKALDLMRNSLSEPLPIPELATKVGCSHSYLRLIFFTATGKGILHHFLEMRIDKARKLLLDTSLTIDEIAYQTGFRNYRGFRAAFVKQNGCSPRKFRKTKGTMTALWGTQLKNPKAEPERYYYEPFRNVQLGRFFKPVSGIWEQRSGYLLGRDSGAGRLHFMEPLPENFDLRFEVCLLRRKGLSSTEFGVGLFDSQFHAEYYGFALGKQDGFLSEFRIQGISTLVNYRFAPKQEVWEKIRIVLEDDTIILSLNGKEVFRHRDQFPPPFAKRSHLGFSLSDGEMGIREFEIFDKGFLPLVRSVRQGDSLYNGGFFSSARDFYMRLLSSKNSTADVMELRYKLGQCFLRERHFLQARSWMEKVIAIPETALWADSALSAMLEMDLIEDRLDNFERSFRFAWEKPYHRQSLKPVIDRACLDFRRRGFFEREFFLRNLLFLSEEQDGYSKLFSRADLAEILIHMRKFEDSERHFLSVIDSPRTPRTMRMHLLFSFCNVLGEQRKYEEWSKVLDRLGPLTAPSPFDEGRREVNYAIFDRAQGKMDKAIERLSQLKGKHSSTPYWPTFACLLGAQILYGAGDPAKARAWIADAERLEPNHLRLSSGVRSAVFYPMELAEGSFERAASTLMKDSETNTEISIGAEQAIKAGILLVLAGKQVEAIAVWKRAAELYPQNRINFYGGFAKSLAAGNMGDASGIPYPAERRSELFYLLGLLCESKSDFLYAKEFFQKSIAEDPLLNWPAVMAGRNMEAGSR